MNVNYDYYRIFYYVAKCGNLSQAARELVNNQPNLTRRSWAARSFPGRTAA